MVINLIGRGWAFPPQIDNRGQLALTQGDSEIQQAIQIILSTSPGERVMRPDFGCRIQELVFAPNNLETCALAERYVREALGRWEPRISTTKVKAEPHHENNGVLMLEVSYIIKTTQDPRSLVFPFYLLPDQLESEPETVQ
ncbi:MAG: GPW/gp25 family protein [Chloroflexi bacterium]|nr:GPW/gp25 family protein [Chloroflexota bacterium]